jgi:hypothetical protein
MSVLKIVIQIAIHFFIQSGCSLTSICPLLWHGTHFIYCENENLHLNMYTDKNDYYIIVIKETSIMVTRCSWTMHSIWLKSDLSLAPLYEMSQFGRAEETPLQVTWNWTYMYMYVLSNQNGSCETMQTVIKLLCMLRAIRLAKKVHDQIYHIIIIFMT